MSSVTIKYGKDFQDTWVVFNDENTGSGSIREQIISYFGLDEDESKDLTLNELAINCTRLAHAANTAVKSLGGKVIKSTGTVVTNYSDGKTDEAQQPSGSTTVDDVFAAAERGEVEPPVDPAVAAIEGATTVEELKAVYAQAQVAKKPLTGATLDMWKARGKALKAAA